jgi:hypothetical protein
MAALQDGRIDFGISKSCHPAILPFCNPVIAIG